MNTRFLKNKKFLALSGILLILIMVLLLLPRQATKISADYGSGMYRANSFLNNSSFSPTDSAVSYGFPSSSFFPRLNPPLRGNYPGNLQNFVSGRIYQSAPLVPISNQCLYTTQIQWVSQGSRQIQVFVRDPDSGQEKLFSTTTPNGNQNAPWISPGKIYRFTLWGELGGNRFWLAETFVNAKNLPCPSFYGTPPRNPSFYSPPSTSNTNNSASVMMMDDTLIDDIITVPVGTTVMWTNQGMHVHTVTADNGSFDSGNLNPGASYTYTFNTPGTYDYYCRLHGNPGGVGMSGRVIVINQPAPNPTPYPYSNPNPSLGMGNSSLSNGFTLTSNNQYCVGQTPTYTIQAGPNLANQTIFWTSAFSGQVVDQPTFALDSSGNWSASGQTWNTSHVGNWVKTATVNGVSQSLNLMVNNCGNDNFSSNPNSNSNFSMDNNNSASVMMMDDTLIDDIITVPVGTTVMWTNQGMHVHTVTADNGSFDSGNLNPGASYTYTFNTPGTYDYYCRLHGNPGGVGMSGRVIVIN